nr:hypothetical protein Iba_scaffold701984CG0010 [Ipomoea batatas]
MSGVKRSLLPPVCCFYPVISIDSDSRHPPDRSRVVVRLQIRESPGSLTRIDPCSDTNCHGVIFLARSNPCGVYSAIARTRPACLKLKGSVRHVGHSSEHTQRELILYRNKPCGLHAKGEDV